MAVYDNHKLLKLTNTNQQITNNNKSLKLANRQIQYQIISSSLNGPPSTGEKLAHLPINKRGKISGPNQPSHITISYRINRHLNFYIKEQYVSKFKMLTNHHKWSQLQQDRKRRLVPLSSYIIEKVLLIKILFYSTLSLRKWI